MVRRPPRGHRPSGRYATVCAVTIALMVVIVLCGRQSTGNEIAQAQRARQGEFALRLQPDLPPDRLIGLDDPVVAAWLSADPMFHLLPGSLQAGGRQLNIRPWIYTTSWLPAPVVPVEADGSFVVRVAFDRNWRSRLLLRLEVEDARTQQVVTTYSYYFVAPGGKR